MRCQCSVCERALNVDAPLGGDFRVVRLGHGVAVEVGSAVVVLTLSAAQNLVSRLMQVTGPMFAETRR